MYIRRTLVLVLMCLLPDLRLTLAHDVHPQSGEVQNSGLGTTHFANSGAARAQPAFLRGLLLLHSFEYPSARKAFREAEMLDPAFAMAYWGEALTYNRTLWHGQDLAEARAALARLAPDAAARAQKAGTERERAYLDSVEQLFGEGSKSARDQRYCDALRALALRYPGDLNARAFYALALLGLTDGDRNVANYMRAAAEAEAILQVDPRHPGALHYLIHATDDPLHAPLGLQAARLYGKVAPAAAHAQHMPSHIFFALGLWDDAIAANVTSLRLGRANGEPSYHALLWLAYAYLQKDEQAPAEALVRSVAADVQGHATGENRARLAYARAMWLVETGGSDGPDARTPVDRGGVADLGGFAAYEFARGVSAAAHDPEAAHAALGRLQELIAAARAAPAAVTDAELEQATLMAGALSGSIRFHDGDRAGGLAEVREASARAGRLVFEYGPPWSVKPLDELLGEMLLEDGRPAEAAEALRRTLEVYPNRRLAREALAAALAAPATTTTPATAGTAPTAAAPQPLRPDQLVGAWRLVGIDYAGPRGTLEDPFYHRNSTGLLTYAASGAMSVQIAGAARAVFPISTERAPGSARKISDERAKALALDTYYAYFGTWELDTAHGIVTHHVRRALLPAEDDASYTQEVRLDGDTLTFTNRRSAPDGEYVRTKTWQRCDSSQRCP